MKLKWIKKPDAPSQDLAAQLKAAQDALDAAKTATQKAQDSFDLTGTPEAQQVLTEAQDAERAAALHVGRAERLLSAAKAREAAETKAQKVARTAELRELVARPAVMAVSAPLIERETDILKQWVEVRIEKQALRRKLARLADEGQALAKELALPRLDDHTHAADNPVLTAEALLVHVATLEADDPRRQMLLSIAHELSPSARTPVRNELAEASA